MREDNSRCCNDHSNKELIFHWTNWEIGLYLKNVFVMLYTAALPHWKHEEKMRSALRAHFNRACQRRGEAKAAEVLLMLVGYKKCLIRVLIYVSSSVSWREKNDGTNLTVTVRSVDTVDIADLYVTASCLLFTLCADAFNTARQSMFVSCF